MPQSVWIVTVGNLISLIAGTAEMVARHTQTSVNVSNILWLSYTTLHICAFTMESGTVPRKKHDLGGTIESRTLHSRESNRAHNRKTIADVGITRSIQHKWHKKMRQVYATFACEIFSNVCHPINRALHDWPVPWPRVEKDESRQQDPGCHHVPVAQRAF